MTTEELKDLIASKIAGQGSAVDAGSALPEILGGVVDLLKNQQDTMKNLVFSDSVEFDDNGVAYLTNEQGVRLQNALYFGSAPLISVPMDWVETYSSDSAPIVTQIRVFGTLQYNADDGYHGIVYMFGKTSAIHQDTDFAIKQIEINL